MSGLHKVTLAPLSDIQLGTQGTDIPALKRYIAEATERNAYFYGVGDFLDVASPSGRAKIAGAEFYDSIHDYLEDQDKRLREQLLKILEPTFGRWLFVLEGHHFLEYRDGETTDQKIARDLGVPFLGTCTITNIVFTDQYGQRHASVQLMAHHGEGSGASIAAPIEKLRKNLLPYFPTVDIFTVAHYHQVVYKKLASIEAQFTKKPKLKYNNKLVACTGGFLQGYTVGSKQGETPRGSYIEKKMLPPTDIGGMFISLTPYRRSGERGVKINVES